MPAHDQGGSDRPVLVIDDDPGLVRMVRLALITEGFNVVTALDGQEGLASIEETPVAAIVLDLQMPRMDGRAFYRELRARGHTAPVLILSAYGALTARDELGAEAALRKPFDPDALVQEVRRLIDTAGAGDATATRS